jgi:hypothetical protein
MFNQNLAPEDAIIRHVGKLVAEATGNEINIYYGSALETSATSDNIVCRIYKDRGDHSGFGFQGRFLNIMIVKIELESPRTEPSQQEPNEAVSQYFKAIRNRVRQAIVEEPANLPSDTQWIQLRISTSDNVPFENTQLVMNRVDIELEAEFVEVVQ